MTKVFINSTSTSDRFLRQLQEAIGDEPYFLAIISDHGDEFFEHGGLDHGQSLFQELLHVPLIVHYPEAEDNLPRRSSTPAPTWSLFPTILDCVDIALPDDREYPGASLRRIGDSQMPRLAQFAKETFAIEAPPYKLISGAIRNARYTGQATELYHLIEDPTEQNNLAMEQPEMVRRLKELLQETLRQLPEAPIKPTSQPLDPELIRQLEALGYTVDDQDGS